MRAPEEATSPFERVLALLSNVKRQPKGGAMATCPAHADDRASLKIDEAADGKAIIYCHANCAPEAVVAAIGLEMRDLFPSNNGHPLRAVPVKIVASFDYRDATGELRYRVVRLSPKAFRQRRPDGNGGWIHNLNGVEPLLYRLPELLAAPVGAWVFIPEGEKKVDALREQFGFIATCNSGGAGKLKADLAKHLKDRKVAILPDNDEPGRGHAQIVAANVALVAAEVRIVKLPGLLPKGDIVDWLEAGGTREQLLDLVAAAPRYKAETAKPILIEDGDQHQVVAAQAFAALHRLNDPVRIVKFAGGYTRIELTSRIVPLDVHRLRDELTNAAVWFNKKFNPAVPSVDFANLLLAKEASKLPAVTRFARGPVFTKDGRLLVNAGYDARSGIFVLSHVFELGAIPEKPSTDEVMAAVDLLFELVQDFPFEGLPDKANAIGFAFERVAREMIEGQLPLSLIEASVPGAGKGLLAKSLLAITNTPAPVWAEVREEAEIRKALTTFFIAGHEVAFLDNITRLTSRVLAAALTTAEWTDRLLGVNRDVVVQIRNSWVGTANNPTGSKEMMRRCSRIRLVPRTERPEDRPASDFKHADLPAWIVANRNELMRALIVLVHHWLAEGKPLPKRVRPLGSYEGWSMTIGGILENAGIEGFQGNRRNFDVADSETAPWRELISQWWAEHGGKLVQSKTLFLLAERIDAFRLKGETERGQRTSFGSELTKWKDRVLTIGEGKTAVELQIVLSPEKLQGSPQWHLVEVKADAR